MNLNDYITWGLDSQGKRLWETIDRKYPTLHEALTFLRELQEAQAKFSPRLRCRKGPFPFCRAIETAPSCLPKTTG